MQPPVSKPDRERQFLRFKREIHERLVTALDPTSAGTAREDQLRQEIRRAAEELIRSGPQLFNALERERLVREVLDEAFGLGPLEPLMSDPDVTDILINGPNSVYVERHGRLEPANVAFEDDRHLRQVVQRIVGRVGRRVDESSPTVDARLPDGSRINAVFPPVALDGTLVSIRRFGVRALRLEDLVTRGALTVDAAEFLRGCVRGRLNMVISGGTGSGKTTFLNALSAFISDRERIVTIEDAAELRLQKSHVARMETRPGNADGAGKVTTRDLVRNALRMRPDRIIVGECRGAEALDMLQAMDTGHDGSLTTLHANDPGAALGRLEIMVASAGLEIPLWGIRRQIASAVHIVVQVARLPTGIRRVVRISEVIGLAGDQIAIQDIFVFRHGGAGSNGEAQGRLHPTGVVPHVLERMASHEVTLDPRVFRLETR
ncbi:MAG: CpaF family protein [Planctomycetes bacterium]|nr:CpaF family protein [Planctomycetota bacterium]